MGTRAGLDGCGKSRPHRDSIPGPSSPYRVAIPTELSRPQQDRNPAENVFWFTLYRISIMHQKGTIQKEEKVSELNIFLTVGKG